MATAVYVQRGDQIDYTPATTVAAGDVVVLGDLVGVAAREIPANTPGALSVEGVFDVAKLAGGGLVFAIGEKAYWDAANKRAVATDGGGFYGLLGKVVRAALDGDATVRVRLCPCAVTAGSAGSSSSSGT